MQAFQSDDFRRMPAEAKRAALKSAIAAQEPGSGFKREFEYDGKYYRSIPINRLDLETEERERPAEA